MKIVIVGCGEMFRALISGVLTTKHTIVGVFSNENIICSPIKRYIKNIFRMSDDYNFIKTHNLYEIKASSVNSEKFREELRKLKADIILVGSWSEKFSMETINTPKKGCINVHPSLLPKFRGPNPYIQTILHNEKKSGITFHLMDVNYDTGSILHQAEIEIPENETGAGLKYKCCNAAEKEVAVLLSDFDQKNKNKISQNEKESTYQSQISLSDSIIDFTKETSREIDRRIRALNPWLKCHICYRNEFFTFADYKICMKSSKKQAGTIVRKTDNSFSIVCKDNIVIEFISLRIKRPFSKQLTWFYLNKIIKVNDKVS